MTIAGKYAFKPVQLANLSDRFSPGLSRDGIACFEQIKLSDKLACGLAVQFALAHHPENLRAFGPQRCQTKAALNLFCSPPQRIVFRATNPALDPLPVTIHNAGCGRDIEIRVASALCQRMLDLLDLRDRSFCRLDAGRILGRLMVMFGRHLETFEQKG